MQWEQTMFRDSVCDISIYLKSLAVILCMALLGACSSIPVEQREARRAEIDRDADETVALLRERDPEFAGALERSAGYFTSRVSSTTVAIVGGAQGIGVLVDNDTGDRTYMNIRRADLGVGLGVRTFRVLLLAEDAAALESMSDKRYFSAVATEATAGKKGGTGGYIAGGLRAFVISDSGASLAATARIVKTNRPNGAPGTTNCHSWPRKSSTWATTFRCLTASSCCIPISDRTRSWTTCAWVSAAAKKSLSNGLPSKTPVPRAKPGN
jgi:hypothetical protein